MSIKKELKNQKNSESKNINEQTLKNEKTRLKKYYNKTSKIIFNATW